MTVFSPKLSAVFIPAALGKENGGNNRSLSLGGISIIRRVNTAGLAGLAGLSIFTTQMEGRK